MSNPHRDLGHIIDKLRAAPRTNHMPHFAPALEAMNAPQIRKDKARARACYIIGAIALALGMALAALAFSNAYARGVDAVSNPHIEGF